MKFERLEKEMKKFKVVSIESEDGDDVFGIVLVKKDVYLQKYVDDYFRDEGNEVDFFDWLGKRINFIPLKTEGRALWRVPIDVKVKEAKNEKGDK